MKIRRILIRILEKLRENLKNIDQNNGEKFERFPSEFLFTYMILHSMCQFWLELWSSEKFEEFNSGNVIKFEEFRSEFYGIEFRSDVWKSYEKFEEFRSRYYTGEKLKDFDQNSGGELVRWLWNCSRIAIRFRNWLCIYIYL